jgi:hypothetical protein
MLGILANRENRNRGKDLLVSPIFFVVLSTTIVPVAASTVVVTTSASSSGLGALTDFEADPNPLENPSDPFMLIRLAKMCSSFSLTGLMLGASLSSFPIGLSCLRKTLYGRPESKFKT